MSETVIGTDRLSRVRALLNQVNETRKAGNPELAYQYSLEASRIAPQDPEVWLARADTAPSIEEKLLCLSRLHALSPYHPDAQRKTYSVLREMLYQEPFLAYLDETDHLYQVRNGPALAVTLPKYRAVPERYPPKRPRPIDRAYRFLALAILGLIPAGLGTLVMAPMAALAAFTGIGTKLDRKDAYRAVSVIVVAAALWLIAIPLVLILVLHLQ